MVLQVQHEIVRPNTSPLVDFRVNDFLFSSSLSVMCAETGVRKLSLLREFCKKTGKTSDSVS